MLYSSVAAFRAAASHRTGRVAQLAEQVTLNH
jgi:hypothetical protein